MRSPLALLFPLLLSSVVSASADGVLSLTGQAGLLDTPGYQPGGDSLQALSADGSIAGESMIGDTLAAWVRSPDGVTRRVGLFTGPGFEEGGRCELLFSSVPGGSWVVGRSTHVSPAGVRNLIPWAVEGTAGVTMSLTGLMTGPEFTSDAGDEWHEIRSVRDNGLAWGTSKRHRGVPGPADVPWVTDLRTGVVSRAGLLLEGYPAAVDRNYERMTPGGWFAGETHVPNGFLSLVSAVWMTRAGEGVSRRLGLWEGIEFTGSDGRYLSAMSGFGDNGLAVGTSVRYNPGGAENGMAGWVADAATGVTRRVGLEGDDYTDAATGKQYTAFLSLTENGYIVGASYIYKNGLSKSGLAVWAGDARTGVVRRVGFHEGDEYLSSGVGYSAQRLILPQGAVAGYSTRYRNGVERGRAAWMTHASGGPTWRVGLSGGSFTHTNGTETTELQHASQNSAWVAGLSTAYRAGNDASGPLGKGDACWVADTATGATRRLWLPGPEFISSAGDSMGSLHGVTDEGWVMGYSRRYQGTKNTGSAAWVANAATGVINRVGLTGPEFTYAADGAQTTSLAGWSPGGIISGTSWASSGPRAGSRVHWLASMETGETRRVEGVITSLSPHGVAVGHTEGTQTSLGVPRVAFLVDVKSGRRVDFELSRGPEDYSHSQIGSVVSPGIAQGTYVLYQDGVRLDLRPFLWVDGLGTLLSDETVPEAGAAAGYEYIRDLRVNARGMAAGAGRTKGLQGSGVYFANLPAAVIPGGGARVTDLVRTEEGKWRLSFSADTAVRIVLQSSADLTTWVDGQAMDAPAGASHMDIEPDPATGPNCYWRLKATPVSP